MDKLKAPYPYFGGKSKAAPLVWKLLGDLDHYVEPFCGSLAVLFYKDPHKMETVNDKDMRLVNAWRSIQMEPEATAIAASQPVFEADKRAREAALIEWDTNQIAEDPYWCDPEMAGWWIWGQCVTIARWCESSKPQGSKPFIANRRGVLTVDNPEEWFQQLSKRLRKVNVFCGGWERVCTDATLGTLTVRKSGTAGVFLDPPYKNTKNAIYNHTEDVTESVVEWCREERQWDTRIVLAGFEGDYDLPDWKVYSPKSSKFGGGTGVSAMHKDRLWASPNCLAPEWQESEQNLFNS